MIICNQQVRRQNPNLSKIVIKIGGEKLEIVNDFKYLGIIIDENLTFEKHGQEIIKKLARKIGLFQRMCGCLPISSKINICQAILTPHFDYCSSILFLLNKNAIAKMQKLQNKVMRSILWVSKRTSIRKMCEALGWLNVKQRIILNTLTLLFKISKGIGPDYLCKKIKKKKENYYNTRDGKNMIIKRNNTKFGNNSIFAKGMRIFNRLPLEVRNIQDVKRFRAECCKIVKGCGWKREVTGMEDFWTQPD